MDVETLKQLPRAELQRLAKSMGLKANGKSADMIKNLHKMIQSQQARRGSSGVAGTPNGRVSSRAHTLRAQATTTDARRRSTRATITPSKSAPRTENTAVSGSQRHTGPSAVAGPSSQVLEPPTNSLRASAARHRTDSHARLPSPPTAGSSSLLAQGTSARNPPPAQADRWMPVIVGERRGEPSFQGAGVSNAKDEEARRTQRHALASHSDTADLRTGGATPTTSPIMHRPHIVPRMYEEPEAHLASATPPGYVQRNQRESPEVPMVPEGPGATTLIHPPLHELEKMLNELEEQATDYPDLRREVDRIYKVIYLIRSKEAWMDTRIKEVQQLRLAIEKHYLAEVKRQPWLLGDDKTESRREDELFGMPVAIRDEAAHNSSKEVTDAPRLSQSGNKRRTEDGENGRSDLTKRIRVSA